MEAARPNRCALRERWRRVRKPHISASSRTWAEGSCSGRRRTLTDTTIPSGQITDSKFSTPCGWAGLAFGLLATLFVERVMDAIQRAINAPIAKVTLDGAARRKILGKITPLASGAQHVHHGVERLSHVCLAPAASPPRRRNERFDMRPLLIRQVARVSQRRLLPARPGSRRRGRASQLLASSPSRRSLVGRTIRTRWRPGWE